MSEEQDKQTATPAGSSDAIPPTAADMIADRQPKAPRQEGLSVTPGLQEVPDSFAPATASGDPVPHVYGPQQAAVDPVAAGLDTGHSPLTRAENRVITRTGELGAGPRPATYVEKGQEVQQAAPADGANVPAPLDADAEKVPGPSGAAAEQEPAPAPAKAKKSRD
ncbi:hypothetical protein [Roseomonas chloroacetimidivorans]|uniref:hypothetical protein n=1 Tax=Roseomonas chloroacetimidivorans TaxID=1766656 RepID=UPI003C721009